MCATNIVARSLRIIRTVLRLEDPRLRAGMTRAGPILIPLMESDFPADTPSCDRSLVIVHDYLEKYPEMLEKDADVIVEKALLEAYTRTG